MRLGALHRPPHHPLIAPLVQAWVHLTIHAMARLLFQLALEKRFQPTSSQHRGIECHFLKGRVQVLVCGRVFACQCVCVPVCLYACVCVCVQVRAHSSSCAPATFAIQCPPTPAPPDPPSVCPSLLKTIVNTEQLPGAWQRCWQLHTSNTLNQ